uniref:Uncharacterized protein n=1 Tax=Vespula pensylvanica TaxID=30213 RepID=A0A834UEU4_VESPE|nr:hypothetical protein H0235_003605 [Vespula pensylvanica]
MVTKCDLVYFQVFSIDNAILPRNRIPAMEKQTANERLYCDFNEGIASVKGFFAIVEMSSKRYDKKDHQEREDGLECHIESRESRILGSKVPLHILSSSFSLTALHFDECNSMREFETSNNVEKAKSRDEEEGSGRMMGTLLLDPLY